MTQLIENKGRLLKSIGNFLAFMGSLRTAPIALSGAVRISEFVTICVSSITHRHPASGPTRLDGNGDSCYKCLLSFASFSHSVTSLSRSLNPMEECRLGVRIPWFMGVGKIPMEAS
jgi:hypothetical protein